MANSALHETAFERIESYVYLAHFQLIILVDFDETGRRNALSDAVQAIHYVQRLTQRTLLTRRLIFLKEGFIFRQCYVGILFEGVVACGTITETLSDQHNDQLDVQHPSDVHDQLFGNIQLLVRCLFPLHGTINNSISTLSKDPYRAGSAMY